MRLLGGVVIDLQVKLEAVAELYHDEQQRRAAVEQALTDCRQRLQAMERRALHAEARIGELERDNEILNGAQQRAQQELAAARK